MAAKLDIFVAHTFDGGRFADHGLDVDVLPELTAFKRLLVETAKEIWRRENPSRRRLPNDFEETFALRFYSLGAGSTTVPLVRERQKGQAFLPYSPAVDELDDSLALILEAIAAADRDERMPDRLPASALPFFADYGRTMRADEKYLLTRPDSFPVHYTPTARERIIRRLEPDYDDNIELLGEVRAADIESQQFSLRLSEDIKVLGKFTSEQETLIMDALKEHSTLRLRVKGRGVFSPTDGRIKRITAIERLEIVSSHSPMYDATSTPIWEVAVDIGARVPVEDWRSMPRDGAANLDRYLYGEGE